MKKLSFLFLILFIGCADPGTLWHNDPPTEEWTKRAYEDGERAARLGITTGLNCSSYGDKNMYQKTYERGYYREMFYLREKRAEHE